ncbi:hypothetical protein MTO96_016921 [Rhipicephalus appendiculatus]
MAQALRERHPRPSAGQPSRTTAKRKKPSPRIRRRPPPDTAAVSCKKHNDLDAHVDPSSSTSLATRPPKTHRTKRHRKLSSNHAVSGTDKSPKRRRRSGSHRHSTKSDGVKLSDSLRNLCILPHSARTARGARKRVISCSSVSAHVEETSLQHHRSRSYSSTTSVLTRRQTKRLRRAVKEALASAAGGASKKRKRSARQPSSTHGESRRKTRRTESWHAEPRRAMFRRIAMKPFAASRHRGMLGRFRPRRRVLLGVVSARVRPCFCRLKMLMRQWKI